MENNDAEEKINKQQVNHCGGLGREDRLGPPFVDEIGGQRRSSLPCGLNMHPAKAEPGRPDG